MAHYPSGTLGMGREKGGSAVSAWTISPSDSTVFDLPTSGIYIGTGGDLVVVMLDGVTATFPGVPDGSLLPIRVSKVLAATTARSLVGLM